MLTLDAWNPILKRSKCQPRGQVLSSCLINSWNPVLKCSKCQPLGQILILSLVIFDQQEVVPLAILNPYPYPSPLALTCLSPQPSLFLGHYHHHRRRHYRRRHHRRLHHHPSPSHYHRHHYHHDFSSAHLSKLQQEFVCKINNKKMIIKGNNNKLFSPDI